MPICVEVPSSTPGWRYGLSKSQSLRTWCLRSLAVSTQSSSLMTSQTSIASRAKVIGEASQSFCASSCHFAQTSSWRLPIATLRSAIFFLQRWRWRRCAALQMRISSGMPSAVSPSARTEQGCMRQ